MEPGTTLTTKVPELENGDGTQWIQTENGWAIFSENGTPYFEPVNTGGEG